MMRERPILFSGEMVRAILEGKKTQTRRVVKPQPTISVENVEIVPPWCHFLSPLSEPNEFGNRDGGMFTVRCPYGHPGDRLYVRETWGVVAGVEWLGPVYRADGGVVRDDLVDGKWKPSIFMPKTHARIWLEVTSVRVERVQQVTEEDAILEGVNGGCLECGNPAECGCLNPRPDHHDSFCFLWDSINAKRGYGWATNPWVWVVEFGVLP